MPAHNIRYLEIAQFYINPEQNEEDHSHLDQSFFEFMWQFTTPSLLRSSQHIKSPDLQSRYCFCIHNLLHKAQIYDRTWIMMQTHTAYKTPTICAMEVRRNSAKWSFPALMTPKTPTWMKPKKYVAAVMDRMAGNFFITGPCKYWHCKHSL